MSELGGFSGPHSNHCELAKRGLFFLLCQDSKISFSREMPLIILKSLLNVVFSVLDDISENSFLHLVKKVISFLKSRIALNVN